MRKAILATIAALWCFSVHAQWTDTIVMPNAAPVSRTIFPDTTYVILDPGGMDSYPATCSGYMTIHSAPGTQIRIQARYGMHLGTDKLNIYDGPTPSVSPLIASLSGYGEAEAFCYSGTIYLHFIVTSHVPDSGFVIHLQTCAEQPEVSGFRVTDITSTSARISWSDASSANLWTIAYGSRPDSLDHRIMVTDRFVTLTDLQESSTYYYRVFNNAHSTINSGFCASIGQSFQTSCTGHYGCIDFTDLSSCLTTARTGNFTHPDTQIGIVDYGEMSDHSRHTVIYNTSAYDERTGNQLKMVPPEAEASVRLGNWKAGSQEESLTYRYEVDTNLNDLLILRYAAVFQNPNHSSLSDNPKIIFQLTDTAGNAINTGCYSATFMASDSLGWNTYHPDTASTSTVLWKDWTAVGIDLAPLHGQTVNIYMATYDCLIGSHYAYAYFTLECGNKQLIASTCGDSDTLTLTAPEGFTYRWYRNNPSETPISTQRSLFVNGPGTFHCRIAFKGNDACHFTLSGSAGPRYPLARFTIDTIDTIGCALRMRLNNQSVICLDPGHDTLTDTPCESYLWTIDDSIQYSEPSPWHRFAPGAHSVQLVAMLADGHCRDTATQVILIDQICHDTIFDTLYQYVCETALPYTWDTVTFSQEGSVTVTRPFEGGDSLVTYCLRVVPTVDSAVYDSIMERQLPWTFMTATFLDTVGNYPIYTTAESGCDSIVYYNLFVFWDGDHCDSSLYFPTAVTPNGDGVNDRFVIGGLLENACFRYNELSIYDRTGKRVYHAQNITREEEFWTPSANMPCGTYFYFFDAHGVKIRTRHTGVIELFR